MQERGGGGSNLAAPYTSGAGGTEGTGYSAGDFIKSLFCTLETLAKMFDDALSMFLYGQPRATYSGPTCFISGTIIHSAEGFVAIEQIEVGDAVWAWDEYSGSIALKEVVALYTNETKELVHIRVDSQEIVTTPSHPFYSPVKGWTDAVHLRAGDILVTVNGEYVVVEKVQHEILEAPVTVYNFQVEGYHTYYVSNAGVLVHNSCNQTYESQNSAMRAAKRSENIPMSEQPTSTGTIKMTGQDGRIYYAKYEIYGNKYIRNDYLGHKFKDGQVMSGHYNAGRYINGNFESNDMHFFY